MPRVALALALAAALGLHACFWQSGPDCSEACDKVLTCKDLDKTFRLNCTSVGDTCFQNEAACADCIAAKTCEQLVAGECDLDADGGELCLVRDD